MVGVLRFKRLAVGIYREELIHHHTSYIQLFVDAPHRIHNQAANLQKYSSHQTLKMMGTMRDFSFAAPLLACMGSRIR